MIAFLQKLVGSHVEQKEVDARFRQNLNGMAVRNQELEELRIKLHEVAAEVRDTTDDLHNTLSSEMSGEHMLCLAEGATRGTGEGSAK